MIWRYEFGMLTINGVDYDSDVIVYSDHVQEKWWRKEGHQLCLDDLKGILGEQFDEDPFLIFRLRGRSQEEIVEVLETMPTDDVADIVGKLPPDTSDAILEKMKKEGKIGTIICSGK